ncbi:MAG: hypothetical protein CH104c_0480 [Candidatus Woesebacteria bacterium]|nr:MAG: hypothetical protein CH104c_0480 [Candidatus Woesebacteria bacterium]
MTKKQRLEKFLDKLEQELVIREVNHAFISELDPSQPWGIMQKTKQDALVQEEINLKKIAKMIEITKKLIAKEGGDSK